MASYFRREDERSMFTSETPHFFKIVMEETIQDGKLKIPRKFMRKYGNGLPSKALLQVPSGAVWEVEISKCCDRLWLQKGWREFAEYYSLRKGHFLVFRYERRNGHFHVLIFDKTASEIEYPFTKLADAEKDSDSESEDDVSIEIQDDIVPCSKKRKEKSPIQSPCRPRKMMNTNMNRGIEPENGYKDPSSSHSKRNRGLEPCKGIQRGINFNGPKCQEQAHHILRFRELPAQEKAKALQIANAFKSENPFFLIVIDQMSYINDKFSVGIPNNFARKYLKETSLTEAILCLDSDGTTWSIRYYNLRDYNGKTRAQIHWREFVLDNNLKAGDLCVLELLKGTKLVTFKVVTHRNFKDAKGYPSRQEVAAADKRAGVNCKGRLRMDLESDSVNENTISSRSKRIFCGERKPGKGIHINGVECQEQDHHILRFQQLTAKEKAKALQIANAFKSENPFFLIVIDQMPYISQNTRMGIPKSFARKYLKETLTAEAILCLDSDGKSWPVRYYNIRRNNGYILAQVYCKEFLLDNNLEAGDICVFELLKGTDMVSFKVVIYRDFKNGKCNPPGQEAAARDKSRASADWKGRLIIDIESGVCGYDKAYTSSRRKEHGNRTAEVDSIQGNKGRLKCGKGPAEGHENSSTFASNNPYFKKTIRSTHLTSCNMDIPYGFIENYFEPNVSEVMLQVADKTWPVNLKRYPEHLQGKLTGGFPKFAKENSLKGGDVCVFEQIAPKNPMLKVSIFRNGR